MLYLLFSLPDKAEMLCIGHEDPDQSFDKFDKAIGFIYFSEKRWFTFIYIKALWGIYS